MMPGLRARAAATASRAASPASRYRWTHAAHPPSPPRSCRRRSAFRRRDSFAGRRGQCLQCAIECQDVDVWRGRDQHGFVERHFLIPAAAFLNCACARVIDEDAPHQPRGDAEKVRPILPPHVCAPINRRNASLTSAVVCSVCPGARAPCRRAPGGAAPIRRAAPAPQARLRRHRSRPAAVR